jgi:ribosomal protein S18 acetylase RimI-like enzyme
MAPEAARLIHAALGPVSDYLFATDNPIQTQELIEQLYRRPGNRFSWEWADAAMEDGRVLGIAISFPYDMTPKLEWKTAMQLLQIAKLNHFLRFLGRSIPMIGVSEAEKGDYYLSDIAVAPEARGKGIGKLLVQHVERKARKHGFERMALTVAQDNPRAIEFYRRQGYRIVGARTSKVLEDAASYPGFYRMVKYLEGAEGEPVRSQS